jgi:hypothetical protein
MNKSLLKSSSDLLLRFRWEISGLLESGSQMRSDKIGAVGWIILKAQRSLASRLGPSNNWRSSGEVNHPGERGVTDDGVS